VIQSGITAQLIDAPATARMGRKLIADLRDVFGLDRPGWRARLLCRFVETFFLPAASWTTRETPKLRALYLKAAISLDKAPDDGLKWPFEYFRMHSNGFRSTRRHMLAPILTHASLSIRNQSG